MNSQGNQYITYKRNFLHYFKIYKKGRSNMIMKFLFVICYDTNFQIFIIFKNDLIHLLKTFDHQNSMNSHAIFTNTSICMCRQLNWIILVLLCVHEFTNLFWWLISAYTNIQSLSTCLLKTKQHQWYPSKYRPTLP